MTTCACTASSAEGSPKPPLACCTGLCVLPCPRIRSCCCAAPGGNGPMTTRRCAHAGGQRGRCHQEGACAGAHGFRVCSVNSAGGGRLWRRHTGISGSTYCRCIFRHVGAGQRRPRRGSRSSASARCPASNSGAAIAASAGEWRRPGSSSRRCTRCAACQSGRLRAGTPIAAPGGVRAAAAAWRSATGFC